jgi:hypothetical protein
VRDWLLKFAVMHNVAFPGVHQIARIVLAVIAAVALAGCANSEAAKRAAAQAAFQAEIKADDAECQSYGAKPDTDAYVQCRLAIDVRKGNAEVAAEAAASPRKRHHTARQVRRGIRLALFHLRRHWNDSLQVVAWRGACLVRNPRFRHMLSMSALGQKPTWRHHGAMFALPLKADKHGLTRPGDHRVRNPAIMRA